MYLKPSCISATITHERTWTDTHTHNDYRYRQVKLIPKHDTNHFYEGVYHTEMFKCPSDSQFVINFF